MIDEQLELDWNGKAARRAADDQATARRRAALRLAAVKWLLEQEPPPNAFAVNVCTRLSKFHADLAAFWSQPVRNPEDEGPYQLLRPIRTAIVQLCLTRDECWPDFTRSQELAPKLRDLKAESHRLEQQIRGSEPHLRDGAALFEEYADWRYDLSTNRDYHRLRKEIDRTEHALYRGTEFERIRQAALADHLYLAVPAGLIDPAELADGWGLLWVDPNLKVTVQYPAEARNCLEGNRLHLVQNIAAAAADAVRFQLGLLQRGDGAHCLVLPPRGHRKPRRLRLE
ncbi:MAG: hypothetical protein WC789_03820 [Lentisphaeria bacterium]|jgi:hypothetical protein